MESEIEEAKAELAKLIDEWLSLFTAKTLGMRHPPGWAWAEELEAFPPYYDTRRKKIILPAWIYAKGYLVDPILAKRALQWVLAHEYWHSVQDQRGEWIKGAGFLAGPTLEERVAVTRASMLTGITNIEGLALTERLMDELIEAKVEEIPSHGHM